MNPKPLRSLVLVIALLAALAVGGCAKKQTRVQGATAEAQPVEPTPAPATRSPVTETPLRSRETPPPETAARERAPERTLMPSAEVGRETTPGLERIHFDFDKYVIKPEAQQILRANADYLTRNPGTQIRIEGHCDERGTIEYNLALGEKRAKSAFQYLMDLGIDPNRMKTISYGEEVPLDPAHNEEAWAKNRRDEFVEIHR